MKGNLFPAIFRWILLPALLLLFGPRSVRATSQNWQLTIGAESNDKAKQAMAFLPAEIWILQGDSITWTTQSHEGHTVTVLDQINTSARAQTLQVTMELTLVPLIQMTSRV